jgi:hypothetical protein
VNVTLVVVAAVLLVVLLGFAVVWVTDRRARKQQDIRASMTRHPSGGKELNNGR